MSPDPSSARIDLLQELVVATRAYGTLLGAGGPVGPGAVVARLAGPEGVEALVGRVAEVRGGVQMHVWLTMHADDACGCV